jgi:hypothetical protein
MYWTDTWISRAIPLFKSSNSFLLAMDCLLFVLICIFIYDRLPDTGKERPAHRVRTFTDETDFGRMRPKYFPIK